MTRILLVVAMVAALATVRSEIHKITSVLQSGVPAPVPATHPARVFSDELVRAKIFETTDRGEELLAIVENTGVVRTQGADRTLSPEKLMDLRILIESGCCGSAAGSARYLSLGVCRFGQASHELQRRADVDEELGAGEADERQPSHKLSSRGPTCVVRAPVV
jgi:hypothetical protein